MKPILEVTQVSKKFQIRHQSGPYLNLRDSLASLIKSGKSTTEEFWALRDINFSVNPGDAIGILGKNGAGKSTLLKILSRITPPTTGKIISRGRIASLLEVGTGFHPELSGRENVFLNGSILGMSRAEITRKFDEIVSFSGTEKFVDTPLKHFSSGMQLRLAFAVAAFLEPEILIIDEVLAVGDHEFQKKCIGKMESVTKSGRTILFVSHNISAVSSLCNKGMLLAAGKLVYEGDVGQVIHQYMSQGPEIDDRHGVRITVGYSHPEQLWVMGSELEVQLEWPAAAIPDKSFVDLAFYTLEGTKVFSLQTQKLLDLAAHPSKSHAVVFRITNPGFAENELRMDIGIKPGPEEKYSILIENAITVTPSSKYLFPHKASDTIIIPAASCQFA